MKNTLLYFLPFFLFQCILLNAQIKPENFYNSNFEKITKTEFEKLSKQPNYRINQYDLNDQIANILYQPKTKGKLTVEEFAQLKQYLEKIEPYKNDFIIIIYFPGKDECNQKKSNSRWNIFDKDFIETANKLVNSNILWIYKDEEDLKYYYPKKINWIKDNDKTIENLFFKMHYPCFSSATIDNEGNFISNLGEFGKQFVIEDVKELMK
ncbi:hypothetical protein [Flavobacterium sp.]|uniref:hypothetical protein n=1 Tax=Flavobacterium sp. TaxID=239 RepID=UPI0026238E1C|nr:hypothetical protein [Flavobacterium sp.]MDD3004802.1 hypothetical protein [Flavobacterium sp.]